MRTLSESILIKLKESDNSNEDIDFNKATDIGIFINDYEYQPDIEPEETFRNSSDSSYFTIVRNERDAERFNYHSDYWGSAEQYQNDNVGLVSSLGLGDSDVGEDLFYFEDEDGKHYFTVTGVAIDRQYNSISHTKILIKEVNNINEAIEQKYEKTNDNFKSFLRDVKHYTGSYDYEFGGKVNATCQGQPITVQYFYWNRPFLGGGYNLEANVLTPIGYYELGKDIQEAVDNAFEKNSKEYLSQKEIKQKILDAIASLDKEE